MGEGDDADGGWTVLPDRNSMVRVFDSMHYLSVGETTTLTEIDDIGDVIEVCDEEIGPRNDRGEKVVKGEIVSIVSFDECESCLSCDSRVVNSVLTEVASCSKCGAVQKSGNGKTGTVVTA